MPNLLLATVNFEPCNYPTLFIKCHKKSLNIGTERPAQTVWTHIRLLLKEQSDQGLHCLPFHLPLLEALLH